VLGFVKFETIMGERKFEKGKQVSVLKGDFCNVVV